MSPERAPQPPDGWALNRRFRNAAEARRAYEGIRDLLLADDLDASTFRYTLEGVSHVAVLGERALSADAERKVRALIEAQSDAAALPEPVLAQLRERRRGFKRLGLDFLEGRRQEPPPPPTSP